VYFIDSNKKEDYMTVRVRFAPSPTGYLHIGGARTALYCYLYAKTTGGTYVLRIEDTDQERSEKAYEEALIDDLKWLGIPHTEGPDCPGDVGPYRQSERNDIYKKYSEQLITEGKAYPCFLTEAELNTLTEKAESEKKAPHAYHGQHRNLDSVEVQKRIENGEKYVVRFKNPAQKVSFKDLVRGEVTFPEDMVGDFVIMRSNGFPVYNFCCVIDDHLMKMSHIIRAEDHLNNTCRQILIYNALGTELPHFVHVSLLVGEDRQKLSKRHGATSVTKYKDLHYLPSALMNYLCLLGWSHPEEKDIFDLASLGKVFTLDRFSKSPALYDVKKLDFFNEQHLRKLSVSEIESYFTKIIPTDHQYHSKDQDWKNSFATLYTEKIQLFTDILEFLPDVFADTFKKDENYNEVISWETTKPLAEYLKSELSKLDSDSSPTTELVDNWMTHLKKELKIKGKPLFMGTRIVLTGKNHGPDLKVLVSLTKVSTLVMRCESALS
jgi:nondiscriminating glutamyl-tRNA synthetase